MPEDVKKQLYSYFNTANELLRHFWSSFPLATPALQQKELRIFNSMSDLYDQIEAFRSGLAPDKRSQIGQLILPIIQTLDKAIDKHGKLETPKN
jgi:transcription initiation factor TFIIH subunit 1